MIGAAGLAAAGAAVLGGAQRRQASRWGLDARAGNTGGAVDLRAMGNGRWLNLMGESVGSTRTSATRRPGPLATAAQRWSW
ncbi:hypothetical protein A5768_11440 [Mycolicibacterium fortuitum]|nr:hypothetical protein A5768_11335 [Mycolicibacterium fortuitum]OBG11825.1 hypothetical protein A5768_11440 [Mycolicibacterium fortuitum]